MGKRITLTVMPPGQYAVSDGVRVRWTLVYRVGKKDTHGSFLVVTASNHKDGSPIPDSQPSSDLCGSRLPYSRASLHTKPARNRPVQRCRHSVFDAP
jgi:hypothetical protein